MKWILILLIGTSAYADTRAEIAKAIRQDTYIFLDDLKFVRTDYAVVKNLPSPNSKTGNWCLHLNSRDYTCGYQKNVFFKLANN